MAVRPRVVIGIVATLAGAAVVFILAVVYLIARTVESTPSAAAEADRAFDEQVRRFPNQKPLIEIVNLALEDFRVNRPAASLPRRPIDTLQFLIWDPEKQFLKRGHAPAWVARLQISPTGFGGWSLQDLDLTMADLERHAPGIILDYRMPDKGRILIWTQE